MLALALVALVSVLVESELFWQELHDQHSASVAFAPSAGFLALKCVLSAATLALVVVLALRYRTRVNGMCGGRRPACLDADWSSCGVHRRRVSDPGRDATGEPASQVLQRLVRTARVGVEQEQRIVPVCVE